MGWEEGECGECGDSMLVILMIDQHTGTCKQCRLIEAMDKIASILEGHLGWN